MPTKETTAITFHIGPDPRTNVVMTIDKQGRLTPGPGLSEEEATQRMFTILIQLFRQAEYETLKAKPEHTPEELLKLWNQAVFQKDEHLDALKTADKIVRMLLDLHRVESAYIKLLGDEISDMMVLADAHGWKSSRIEQGETVRGHIARMIQSLSEALPGEKL